MCHSPSVKSSLSEVHVPLVNLQHLKLGSYQIDEWLDKNERHVLAFTPWHAYPYQPEVHFSILHGGDCILLKYYVKEKEIRAVNVHDQTPVYEDSCVECFIQVDDDQHYYNLEANCIGAILFQYGNSRNDRTPVETVHLNQIERQAKINYEKETGLVKWEISLRIPVGVFSHHNIHHLSGRSCKANFYKCGDRLSEPHFVSWADIQSDEPDFHVTQFFGRVAFL